MSSIGSQSPKIPGRVSSPQEAVAFHKNAAAPSKEDNTRHDHNILTECLQATYQWLSSLYTKFWGDMPQNTSPKRSALDEWSHINYLPEESGSPSEPQHLAQQKCNQDGGRQGDTQADKSVDLGSDGQITNVPPNYALGIPTPAQITDHNAHVAGKSREGGTQE